jgi:hypothetical protein
MKTEKELGMAILAIAKEIKERHPEYSKYISDRPTIIKNMKNPEMIRKALQEYIDSLRMFSRIIENH